MALTTQEEAAVRALLQGVGVDDLTAALRTIVTEGQQGYNANITGGSISGNNVELNTRQGADAIPLQGTLPNIPTDTIRQGQLDSAIAAVRQLPEGGNPGDYVTKGAGTTSSWTAFTDTREAGLVLGTNLLLAPIPANTAQHFATRLPIDTSGDIEYRLIFQAVGDESINGYVPALGDTRPKAMLGGSFVFVSSGISITNGFNANLVGLHTVTARGNAGPRGPAGTTLTISSNLLPQALAANGSSRTVNPTSGFDNPLGVYIGIITATAGYQDHEILTPFRTGRPECVS